MIFIFILVFPLGVLIIIDLFWVFIFIQCYVNNKITKISLKVKKMSDLG